MHIPSFKPTSKKLCTLLSASKISAGISQLSQKLAPNIGSIHTHITNPPVHFIDAVGDSFIYYLAFQLKQIYADKVDWPIYHQLGHLQN